MSVNAVRMTIAVNQTNRRDVFALGETGVKIVPKMSNRENTERFIIRVISVLVIIH